VRGPPAHLPTSLSLERHVGFILRSPDDSRIIALRKSYGERVKADFFAFPRPPEKPTN